MLGAGMKAISSLALTECEPERNVWNLCYSPKMPLCCTTAQISLFCAIVAIWSHMPSLTHALFSSVSAQCSSYRRVCYLWLHLNYNGGCYGGLRVLFAVVEFQFFSNAPLILYRCVSAMASGQILLSEANVLPAHIRHCEQDLSFTLLVLLRCGGAASSDRVSCCNLMMKIRRQCRDWAMDCGMSLFFFAASGCSREDVIIVSFCFNSESTQVFLNLHTVRFKLSMVQNAVRQTPGF